MKCESHDLFEGRFFAGGKDNKDRQLAAKSGCIRKAGLLCSLLQLKLLPFLVAVPTVMEVKLHI
jgi:hypothetical protein